MNKSFPLKWFVFFFLFSILAFSSCELINPDETIPAYISIDKIVLHTDYTSQGSASHKITDAWVYVDDQLVGAFELPASFPVLIMGNHRITIRPGIKLNGISSTRDHYAFFEPIIQDTALETEQTLYLDLLSTTYSSITDFAWMEDFEDGGISLEKTSRSDTTIQKISILGEVCEGSYSGVIYLDPGHTFFELKTSEAYTLPKSNAPVFLELNYKCNNSFIVGILANTIDQSTQHSVLVINKSDVWNKIYVNLTTAVSRETSAIDYQIFFGGFLNEDATNSRIYIDNIKLVHY